MEPSAANLVKLNVNFLQASIFGPLIATGTFGPAACAAPLGAHQATTTSLMSTAV
jgi:hypothetical protein